MHPQKPQEEKRPRGGQRRRQINDYRDDLIQVWSSGSKGKRKFNSNNFITIRAIRSGVHPAADGQGLVHKGIALHIEENNWATSSFGKV